MEKVWSLLGFIEGEWFAFRRRFCFGLEEDILGKSCWSCSERSEEG